MRLMLLSLLTSCAADELEGDEGGASEDPDCGTMLMEEADWDDTFDWIQSTPGEARDAVLGEWAATLRWSTGDDEQVVVTFDGPERNPDLVSYLDDIESPADDACDAGAGLCRIEVSSDYTPDEIDGVLELMVWMVLDEDEHWPSDTEAVGFEEG